MTGMVTTPTDATVYYWVYGINNCVAQLIQVL